MNPALLPCCVLVYEDDLRIVEANERAAEALEYSVEGLLACTVGDLLGPGARIFFHTSVNASLALHGRIDEVYFKLRARGGESVPVVVNGVRDTSGPAPRNVLAFLPMRRRQLFEHELIAARDAAQAAAILEREARTKIKDAQAKLALQERLASLGTLAHGIAHEINNPLTCTVASLELIADDLRAPRALDRDDLLALVREAREGTDRIREITQQMQSLGRAEELPRTPLDLRREASSVARMTNVHTRERARVELELGAVPPVNADSGRLGQVLINLVLNAAQAFGDRPAGENVVRVSTRTGPDGTAQVEVADNGPGIPPEVADRVFEPFFTTKPVGEGTGLGLSISRALVESLDGTLTFETEVGKGTTFRVALPPAPPSEPEQPAPATPPAPARRRVLVVDDDEGVARMLARVLRQYDVTVALSADEAVARVREGPPFDHVFTDLHMPRADGFALRDAIAVIDPALARRTTLLTGALTKEAERRARDLGMRVFSKPIDVTGFLAYCDERIA